MKLPSKKGVLTIALIVLVSMAIAAVVYAAISWSGSASWTTAIKSFTVRDSATAGTVIASPYVIPNLPSTAGTYTYSFYLQNDGNTALTVTATGSITGTGNTASWSSSGVYSLPVSTTQIEATLTLNIQSTGTYSWAFTGA
jgi:hypothetical protein